MPIQAPRLPGSSRSDLADIRQAAGSAQRQIEQLGGAAAQSAFQIQAGVDRRQRDRQALADSNAKVGDRIAVDQAVAAVTDDLRGSDLSTDEALLDAQERYRDAISGVQGRPASEAATALMQQRRDIVLSNASIQLEERSYQDGVKVAQTGIAALQAKYGQLAIQDPANAQQYIDGFNAELSDYQKAAPENALIDAGISGSAEILENSVRQLTSQNQYQEALDLLRGVEGLLTPDQRGALEKSIQNGKEIASRAGSLAADSTALVMASLGETGQFSDSGLPLGRALNKENRTQLNNVFDAVFVPTMERMAPEDKARQLTFLTSKWGMIPATAKGWITGPLRKTNENPDLVAEASQLFGAVTRGNKFLLDEIPIEEQQLATNINALMAEDVGLSATDAVGISREALNLEQAKGTDFVRIRSDRYVDDLREETHEKWLAAEIDEGEWENWTPGFIDLTIPDEMLAALTTLSRTHYRKFGNMEGSREWALLQLQTVWNPTYVDDQPRWTVNGAETVYAAIGHTTSPDGLRKEYTQALSAAIPAYKEDPEAFYLELDPLTHGPHKLPEKEEPEWFVMKINSRGERSVVTIPGQPTKKIRWSSPSYNVEDAAQAKKQALDARDEANSLKRSIAAAKEFEAGRKVEAEIAGQQPVVSIPGDAVDAVRSFMNPNPQLPSFRRPQSLSPARGVLQ